jgi:hypothetical protein
LKNEKANPDDIGRRDPGDLADKATAPPTDDTAEHIKPIPVPRRDRRRNQED